MTNDKTSDKLVGHLKMTIRDEAGVEETIVDAKLDSYCCAMHMTAAMADMITGMVLRSDVEANTAVNTAAAVTGVSVDEIRGMPTSLDVAFDIPGMVTLGATLVFKYCGPGWVKQLATDAAHHITHPDPSRNQGREGFADRISTMLRTLGYQGDITVVSVGPFPPV